MTRPPFARSTRRRAAALAVVVAGLVAAGAILGRAPRAICGGVATRLDTVESCGACGRRCAAVHAAAACVEQACVLTCEAGHADCDGHPGNGCEVDLATDRAHCGLCTRSCGGARCEGGRCVARLIGNGEAIAADDAAVYALGASVVKYPLDGGDPVAVAPEAAPRPPPSVPAPARGYLQIADGDAVYWVEPGPDGSMVRRMPKAGGEAVTVVSHPYALRALAFNATHLFWSDEKQRIFMAPKTSR